MNLDFHHIEFPRAVLAGGEVGDRPSTVAGNYICRRYPVRPVVADLIAALAGLSIDQEIQ